MKRFAQECFARVAPLAATLVITIIDREVRGSRSLLVHGAADEVAHLLTGIVLIIGARRIVPWVHVGAGILGSVVIDLDHAPEVLGLLEPSGESSRFVTHSMATVSILIGVSLLDSRRRFAWISAALGVMVHLFRDAATGSIIVAWPLSEAAASIPYGLYWACLLATSIRLFSFRSITTRHLGGGVRHEIVPTQEPAP